MPATSKKSSNLTLKDRLSRLTFLKAAALLGAEGSKLIQRGGKFEINDLSGQVDLDACHFRLRLPYATVFIELNPAVRGNLEWRCDACTTPCEHVGAAFALILEEKMALGLAAAPKEQAPIESLPENELVRQALKEREERATSEKMYLKSLNGKAPWSDYSVRSALSGKTYRVSLRGFEPGQSYCTCPDFRKNTLGTCKHLMNALNKIKRRFSASQLKRPYRRKHFGVHLRYGVDMELRLLLPHQMDPAAAKVVKPIRDEAITDLRGLLRRVRKLEALGEEVRIYPDAEEFIQQRLFQEGIQEFVEAIRKNPKKHPLRKSLLKTELLPYQMDGIAFAVGARRAVLADDMGLGKTIQGIGVAELLAQKAGIKKVLVICPASLKSQWRAEVHRFSSRECELVLGSAEERAKQYGNETFMTVCNYEQCLRDILAIEQVPWDLIILDEGQRIKNWEAKTSGIIKSLRSPFALVLSGTPLENRLDDLFSVVEFIDERRLGPAFRFYHRHRVVDEKGKVLGYRKLDELRRNLKPILLRRTRHSVMKDLPPRTNEVVRIVPADEQVELHRTHMQVVSSIVGKKFLTEMDLLRLQKALLMCRLSANSTFLVDKEPPGHSSKLEKLDELFDQLAQEKDRKVVLFSEWTRMLGLIEPLLEKSKLPFVRLDGSIPQKQRQKLVHEFQHNSDCKFFITTNAGSTGLNLQAANTVVNVDLPWNPAVLEQRIARAHRMGQKRPVQVYILVTEGTIEENLLATLSAKHELALAALDSDSTVTDISLSSGMEELRRRLELLLGARPEAPLDETKKAEAERAVRKEKMAEAGGRLLESAFAFMGQMLPAPESNARTKELAAGLKERLAECVSEDEGGQAKLTVTLPNKSALDGLANALAGIMAMTDQKN